MNNAVQMMPTWVADEVLKTPISPLTMCWQGMFILENIITMKDAHTITDSKERTKTEKMIRATRWYALVLLLQSALLGSTDALHFIVEEIDPRGLAFLAEGVSSEMLEQWTNDKSSEYSAEINKMIVRAHIGFMSTQYRHNQSSEMNVEKVD